MKIRLAMSADAQAIAALHTSSWRRTYKNALSDEYLQRTAPIEREAVWAQRFASRKENQQVLVAEGENGVVGFACAYGAEHVEWGSYLDNLHVDESFQRQGIGRSLLVGIARWCDQQTPGRGLYLSVNQDNRRAQRFYRGLGAHNAKSGVWNAPDGSAVPTYWFVWESIEALVAAAANHSFQLTACGGAELKRWALCRTPLQ